MGTIIENFLIMAVLLAGFVTFLAVCVFVANHGLRLIRERRAK